MDYEFIDNGNSININYNNYEYTAAKNDVELVVLGVTENKKLEVRSNSAILTDFTIDLDNDTITGVGAGSSTATELRDALEAIFFLSDGQIDAKSGFIDYNDTTGPFSITADTWTDLPNNGLGAFTNKNYPPINVTDLIDTSTGYIETSELDLGDTILIRNDFTINPNTNNALLKFRYEINKVLDQI